MKKLLLFTCFMALFFGVVFLSAGETSISTQTKSGAFKRIVDENSDGTADKVYVQQCFGSVPGGLWSVNKPTKEDQEFYFRNKVLAVR